VEKVEEDWILVVLDVPGALLFSHAGHRREFRIARAIVATIHKAREIVRFERAAGHF